MEDKEGEGPLSTGCIQEKGFCERLNPQYCLRKQRQGKGHPRSQNTSFKFLSELSIEDRTHSEGENQAGGWPDREESIEQPECQLGVHNGWGCKLRQRTQN